MAEILEILKLQLAQLNAKPSLSNAESIAAYNLEQQIKQLESKVPAQPVVIPKTPISTVTIDDQQTDALTDTQLRSEPVEVETELIQYADGQAAPSLLRGLVPIFDDGGTLKAVSAADPLPVAAVIDTSAIATSAIQTDGTQKTQIVDVGGEAVTVTGGKLDVNASVDTTGLATEAKQDTGNTSLASIDAKITNPLPISAAALPLPAGAATAANQVTEIAGLASIDTQLASQATAAKQDSQTSLLTTIDADTSNLDVALSTRLKPADTLTAVALNSDVRQATAANLNMTEASAVAIKTAVEVMDDWDESDRAKVNVIVGQAGITAGAGSVAANTPRVTHASDDPVVTALATPTTIFNGKTTVTTAGTRVVLAASQAVKSVTIKALSTNTGIIYVGNATVAAANGYELLPGDSVSMDIANLNTVNIDSSVNGEGVSYIGIN